MAQAEAIWAGEDAPLPEGPMATLAILEDRLTPRGRERFLREMHEASTFDEMQSVELAWLRTAAARSDPGYFRGRNWAMTRESEHGISLKALRAELSL